MNKMNKQQKIPYGWKEHRFDEIFNRVNCRNSELNKNTLTISAQHGLVSQEDFFNKKIATGNLSNYILLNKGDFAYNKSYSSGFPMGAIKRLDLYDKGIVSSLYICFRPTNEAQSDYLKYYFESGIFNKQISKIAQEGARNHGLLNMAIGDFFGTLLILPSLSEQIKISDVFKTFSVSIETINEKIKIIKKIKKGLVQKLVSDKIRISKFANDWEYRYFRDVLLEHKEKSTGIEEVYSVSVNKGLVNQIEHLGKSYSAKDTSNYNLVKPGDIVYTKSPTGNFPLGIIKQSRIDKRVIVSPLYGVFTPETYDMGIILDAFFSFPINVKNYLTPIVQKGAKNTIAITNTTFLSRGLVLPKNKKEQAAIANIITTTDKEIQFLEKQKKLITDQKKYLLNNLITGQIRMPEFANKN